MANIESICERIFSDEPAWRRTLFGGLLCLSIVGIPLAGGYLFRYAARLRAGAPPSLEAWKDWPGLLNAGWHFLGVFAAWFLGPLLLMWLAGWLLEELSGDILWWIGYLLGMCGLAIAPLTFIAVLNRYIDQRALSVLWDLQSIFRTLTANWRNCILPALVWTGLIMATLPLLPFAFFLGMVVLIPYISIVVFGANNARN